MRSQLIKFDWSRIDFAIETGTYQGATTRILREFTQKVFTIEISKSLFELYSPPLIDLGINCLNCDTLTGLKEILGENVGNYFVFLDAHGSQGITSFDPKFGATGTPILEEIKILKNNPPHIIIVDDWNDFGKQKYPSKEAVIEQVSFLGQYSLEDSNFGNGQLIVRRNN